MPIARGEFLGDFILGQGREKLHPQLLNPEPDRWIPDRSWLPSFQSQYIARTCFSTCPKPTPTRSTITLSSPLSLSVNKPSAATSARRSYWSTSAIPYLRCLTATSTSANVAPYKQLLAIAKTGIVNPNGGNPKT